MYESHFLTNSMTFRIVTSLLLLPLLLVLMNLIIIYQSDYCKIANCCLYLSVLLICYLSTFSCLLVASLF